MYIELKHESEVPLYLQIKNFLKEQILSGSLPPGSRLPSTRSLAQRLGVARITVQEAYDELIAEGLLSAHVGRGTFVQGPGGEPLLPAPPPEPPWEVSPSRLSTRAILRDMLRMAASRDILSFAAGVPAPEFFPVDGLRRAINRVLRREGVSALQYDVPEGLLPLRQSISRYLVGLGIVATPETILITSGTQQAIDLVARTLVEPGDAVVLESPTYIGAIDAFEARGAKILAVPVDEEGMCLKTLRLLLVRYRPRLIYTIPTFHSPRGGSMSLERRRQLLALAREHAVLILEDDAYSELYYQESPPPPLRALDTSGYVIYLGGFSKTLFAGLRIGYMVVPHGLRERLMYAKQTADLHTSSLIQWAVNEFIQREGIHAHLRRIRAACKERRDAMVRSMERHFPPGVEWTLPQGGLYLWAKLPREVNAFEVFFQGLARGVAIAPGPAFFPDRTGEEYIRLNFSLHPPDRIEEGIRKVGETIRFLLDRARRARPKLQRVPVPIL
ncbi:MAG: PLP-dependent aminotransferase family protein [Armatimonadota bacterium]|nr:PLP-dependent aminotransferase family protein [Armatimonadota bacterium]